MSIYQYIARTADGQKVTGVIEAGSESAASRQLGERSLFPVRVTPRREAAAGIAGIGARKLGVREQAALFEQLADLLRAGVPIVRALDTLIKTCNHTHTAVVIKHLRERVSEGAALADAMAERTDAFRSLQVAMVRAGERGGFLEQVLTDMAGYLERQDELRSRVRGAMIYPIILVGVGVLVVSLCLIWLVPKFKPLFEGMALPLPTRVLFTASDMLAVNWPVTLAFGGLLAIALAMVLKSPAGQRLAYVVLLRLPLIGHAILMVSLTRLCRILGTMLASGVPIMQALSISRDAVGLPALAEAVDDANESVRRGEGLAPPLRRCQMFPPQILEMIAVAEESNQLEKTLLKIADTVERRTNRKVDQAVRAMEPAILVLLAGTILFVALGLLYPIFTMARMIQ